MRLWLAVVAALIASGGSGCVRPWQREALQRIQDRLDRPSATRSYEAHLWMVREGAIGGQGKPGGGCGCN